MTAQPKTRKPLKPLKLTKANVARLLNATGLRPYQKFKRRHLERGGYCVWGDAQKGVLYVSYLASWRRRAVEWEVSREILPQYIAALAARFSVALVDPGLVTVNEVVAVRAKEAPNAR